MATRTEPSDDEILDFERKWARLGGGSADVIREQFDLPETEFFSRLLDLTSGTRIDDEALRRRLRRVAHSRLWLRRAQVAAEATAHPHSAAGHRDQPAIDT